MPDIEAWLLPNECVAETYLGDMAYGDAYARPRTIRCAINDRVQLVRGSNGDEQVSQTTLLTLIRDAPLLTPDTRVTVNGRRTFVIARNIRNSAGLGLGDHAEVNLR